MTIKYLVQNLMSGTVLFMSNRKILFCTAEGIGNVVQCIPAIRTLKEVLHYDVDCWWAFGHYTIPKIFPYVDEWIVGQKIRSINPAEYVGKVSTFFTINHLDIPPLDRLPLLNTIQTVNISVSGRSEVDVYMDIARDLGAEEENLIWHGKCNYNKLRKAKNQYDIVIHSGYNRHGTVSDNWHLKGYPYYERVVELLPEFKICSVGSKDEYIEGTDDKTGLDLLTTGGIIKNSKLLIGNDSGLYHCANALSIPNIVIFTYTSTIKNYDKRFHKYSKILQNDKLDCLSCQNTPRFKTCKTRKCRNIDPRIVSNIAREMLR